MGRGSGSPKCLLSLRIANVSISCVFQKVLQNHVLDTPQYIGACSAENPRSAPAAVSQRFKWQTHDLLEGDTNPKVSWRCHPTIGPNFAKSYENEKKFGLGPWASKISVQDTPLCCVRKNESQRMFQSVIQCF